MKRKLSLLILGILVAFSSIAQSREVIGLSVLTMTNPFFKEIADKLTKAADEAGYDMIVVSSDLDPALQNHQINDFITRKVAAIILNPADSKAVGEAIKQANRKGIPVFTCDIACTDSEAKVVCHIATDNYLGGRMAARALMRGMRNQGEVVIVGHQEVESAQLRVKGFRDELAEAKSPIVIVQELNGKGARDESFKVASEAFQAHPRLRGFFACNDPCALGIYAAAVKSGREKGLVIVGFDGMPEGRKAVLDKWIYADAMQSTDAIATNTMNMLLAYLDGEKVPDKVLIPTEIYDYDRAMKEKKAQDEAAAKARREAIEAARKLAEEAN